MQDASVFALDAQTALLLKELCELLPSLRTLFATGSERGRSPIINQHEQRLIRVTNTTLSSGRYPAKLVAYDAVANTFSDLVDIWAVEANAGTLTTQKYVAHRWGVANGRPVFQVGPGGSTSGGGAADVHDWNHYTHLGNIPGESHGAWYTAGWHSFSGFRVSEGVSLDLLHAGPFVKPLDGTIDALGAWMAIGATPTGSSRVRFGIYTNTSPTNLYPDALVAETGEVTAVSANTFYSGAVTANLTGGELYWFVMLVNETQPWISDIPSGSVFGSRLALDPLLMAGGCHITRSQSYGSLPDPFPSGGAVSNANDAVLILGHFSAFG